MNQNEPTTGELIAALKRCREMISCEECVCFQRKISDRVYLCDHNILTDRLESQEQTISALTARAEQAEANMPWVRLDGYDYFVQVKLFHHSDNNLTVYDKKYGWHTVEYSQVKEWRGLPKDGEGK